MEEKSKKYFELQERFETEVLDSAPMMWQLEKKGEVNSFTISAYMVESHIVLTQNFYNGNGLFAYLPDGERTYAGSKAKLNQLLTMKK